MAVSVTNCEKITITEAKLAHTQFEEREDPPIESETIKYNLDNTEITEEMYNSLSESYWFHSTSKVTGTALFTTYFAFSTKKTYEEWGVVNNIQVAKLNIFDDRVSFLCDSFGITPIVLAGGTPSASVIAAFEAKIEESIPVQQIGSFSYKGCKFYANSCNPASCNNPGVSFLLTYLTLPTWISYPPAVWLEDNAEAWEPSVHFNIPNNGYSVTLRAWRFPFFVNNPFQSWKKKHTVIFTPGTPTKLFVPFLGPLSIWKNKISSWVIIP